MNKMNSPKTIKRTALILCLIAIAYITWAFLAPSSSYDKFTNICDTILKEELSQDSLSLHFTLSNPEKYHISTSQIVLPSLKKEDRIKQNAWLEEHMDSINNLKTKKWSYPQNLSMEVILSSISGSLEGEQFIYFYEPFSSSHGIQSEYPLLLFEYAFRNEDDIKQYLQLLEATPDYFQSMVTFEKERLANGHIFSESNAKSAIKACDNFASAKTAFISTFEKKMQPLLKENLISPQVAEKYSAKNLRLVETILLPAFTKLGDDLLLLKQHGMEEKSLYNKKDGKEYYAYLLKESVGTSKNVSEVKTLLIKDLQSNLKQFNKLLNSQDIQVIAQTEDPLNTLSPTEMMEDLKVRMQKDFNLPSSPDYSYEVQSVDACLEPYTAPAYYFTPPLDNLKENHIYINEKQTTNGIHLYTTLAHEGFPGHLYQTVTSQNHFTSADTPLLRGIIHYGGYVEGYATYAELYSYKYAKEYANTTGSNAASLYDIYYYDRRIKLCLYSLLDIMIHGEGKSLEEITVFLSKFGTKDASAAAAVYDYILNEPTTYLKYYVGYLEILECQQLAMDNWGSNYSDQRFHKYLLEIGPAPFSILKEYTRKSPLVDSRAERGRVSDIFLVRASVHFCVAFLML